MKKFLPVLFFLAPCSPLLTLLSPAQGVWTQKADYGGGLTRYAAGFSIGNKGYIGTGWDSTGTPTKQFWEWDQATNVWTQKADFGGVARTGAGGFSIGNKGYAGAGMDTGGNVLNDFWEYDPATNAWTQKANFQGTARLRPEGFSIGAKGYICMGVTASWVPLSDCWEYNPVNDSWLQVASPSNVGRESPVGFMIGTKGYLGTGNDTSLFNPTTNTFWEYDPAINAWTQKANLPVTKCGAAGFSIGTKGYIGTGPGPISGNTRDFYEYDPSSNTWGQKPDFGGTARRHAVGFSIGSKGYIGTGSFTKDFWEYDPNAIGMNEIENNISVSLYPNPMHESATLQISNSIQNLHFELYDVRGRCVLQSAIADLQLMIHRGNLAAGIFVYHITDGTKSLATGKLIIQ
jgi:N-acetylneuraminic acid mutarotase